MKVRIIISDLYGITILQFFRSTEEHSYLCFLKQRLSGSDLYTSSVDLSYTD